MEMQYKMCSFAYQEPQRPWKASTGFVFISVYGMMLRLRRVKIS